MYTKTHILEALILATSNVDDAAEMLDNTGTIRDLLSDFVDEWDELECDDEGFNEEQNKAANKLLATYVDKVHKAIDHYHTIEFDEQDKTISWYDGNSKHTYELEPCYEFNVWDVDLASIAVGIGYDLKTINEFIADVENAIPYSVMSSQEAHDVLKAICRGEANADALKEFFPCLPDESEDVISIMIERYKAGNVEAVSNAFEQLRELQEN